jgi:hypothetical protein
MARSKCLWDRTCGPGGLWDWRVQAMLLSARRQRVQAHRSVGGRPRLFAATPPRRGDFDDMHTFSGALDWQGRRNLIALKMGRKEQKRWPLHEKVGHFWRRRRRAC